MAQLCKHFGRHSGSSNQFVQDGIPERSLGFYERFSVLVELSDEVIADERGDQTARIRPNGQAKDGSRLPRESHLQL